MVQLSLDRRCCLEWVEIRWESLGQPGPVRERSMVLEESQWNIPIQLMISFWVLIIGTSVDTIAHYLDVPLLHAYT